MVNLYDNYQQSQVMNIVPDYSKELLRLKKEELALDVSLQKEIDNLDSKYNIQFESPKDAAEFASIIKSQKDEIQKAVNDPSADIYTKYSNFLNITRKFGSNKRLSDLKVSNDIMREEKKKIHPSLMDYHNIYVAGELRTPENIMWSGSWSEDPIKDKSDINSNIRNSVLATEYKDEKDGKVKEGIQKIRVQRYINDNYLSALETYPGFNHLMMSKFYKETGEKYDKSNPNHEAKFNAMAKGEIMSWNSEFFSEEEVKKAGNTYVNANVYTADQKTPLLGTFFDEQSTSDYGKAIANGFGLKRADGSFDDVAVSAKIKSKYSEAGKTSNGTKAVYIPGPNAFLSTNDLARKAWLGLEPKKITSNITESKEVGGNKSSALSNITGEKPSGGSGSRTSTTRQNSVYSVGVTDSGIIARSTDGKSAGEFYSGDRAAAVLRKISSNDGVYITTDNRVSKGIVFMHDGAIGSIATISIPADKNNISSSAEYFKEFTSGESNLWAQMVKAGLHLPETKSGSVEFKITNGSSIKVTKEMVLINNINTPVFSFDAVTQSADIANHSFRNADINDKRLIPHGATSSKISR